MNSCGNSKLHQQSQVTESIGRGEETTDINKLLAYLFIRIYMVSYDKLHLVKSTYIWYYVAIR